MTALLARSAVRPRQGIDREADAVFGPVSDTGGNRISIDKPSIRDLVEAGGWWRLAPAVRARFDAMEAAIAPLEYCGEMTVEMSRVGWLFAQACRLIGSPLTYRRGKDVRVEVSVYPGAKGRTHGIWWQRNFHFPGHALLSVRSLKVIDPKAGLLECVDGGLGMQLRIYAEAGALHFECRRYFLRVGRFRLRLPCIFTPGRAHVMHRDEGKGAFTFRITFRHPLFGTTFFQEGIFRPKGA